MEIVELCSAEQRREALPILRELYPSLDEDRYARLLEEMVADRYRQFAVRHEAGELVAVAGAAVHVNLYYGRHLYLYDLVVTEGQGTKDTGSCSWTTWKASPGAKGARPPRWRAVWSVRGRSAPL